MLTTLFTRILPYLLGGVVYTVVISVIALFLGLLIGTPVAIARVYGRPWLQRLALTYTTVMRGIPSLVVIFLAYYVIGRSLDLSPLMAGCVSLAVCSSAYQAEILRGAIQGVEPGQMMAARAVGMSQRQAILTIVLPQALRNAIPGWSNEAAVVVKDSSLVYAVGIAELMRQAQRLNATLHAPLLIFSITGLLYFLLTFAANRLLDWAEQRTQIPGLAGSR